MSVTNEWTALHTFWNQFEIPAYDQNTVPDDATMPYITYEASVGGFGDVLLLRAKIYYRSMSWAEISDKVKEIQTAIGGGYGVRYTNGRLWVIKGDPFAQRLSEPEDVGVRTILMQIGAEYQTAE